MVYLKTKNCPFCGKEISDEAIICKYCHRLLIDENGNDILPEGEIPETSEDAAVTEDKTIVYKKEDLQKLMNKKGYEEKEDEDEEEEEAPKLDLTKPADNTDETKADNADIEEEDNDPFEEDEDEEADASAVINNEQSDDDDGFPADDEDFGSDEDEGDGYEYENEPLPRRNAPRRPRDDRYDDADLADTADYDPKRTFIVTAIVTLGILVIIIVAILVGYKLFHFGGSGDTTEPAPLAANSSAAEGAVSAADNKTAASTADSSFVPSVVNDTLSENPEEIVNSAASDPVVDSAATAPEASAPDSSAASTESGVNIVIRPDPNAGDSTAADTSATDSQTPGDGPSSASSSAAEPAGPGAPSFEAAGSYYSWGEANTLMDNYASSNGLGSYEYYSGTDGVEMIYAVYDANGNPTLYRVDLQTGYVSAY